MLNEFLGPDEVSSKLMELEDRSCRINLRIDCIPETTNETWGACKGKKSERNYK